MTGIHSTGGNTLRATNAALGPHSDSVEIDFHGRVIEARRGESLLAAMIAAGEFRLRVTHSGQYRGPFCGMGVCQECLVEIDGAPAQRACLTTVEGAMSVRRQTNRVSAASAQTDLSTVAPGTEPTVLMPQIAVIGGGPGGMAAAVSAANAGADVLLIDERPKLGGQFYKQPLDARDLRRPDYDDRQFRAGRQLIAELEDSGAAIMRGAKLVGVFEPLDLVVSLDNETRLVRPQILIVATGAYETCYPFKGWTLPGVMTTGAAQTLLRSYRVLPGRRVLIAGNGPLNFQVAAELINAGAEFVTVAEAAARPALSSLGTIARMMTSAPDLALKGAGHLSSLLRKRAAIIYGQKISRVEAIGIEGTTRLMATVQSLSGGKANSRDIEVDAVCLGYGFSPSNEILRGLGCRHDANPNTGALETVRSKDCLTSRDDVFAVGDCTRMGGAPMAVAEGLIAASAALRSLGIALTSHQENKVAQAHAMRLRHGRFQQALWTLFRPAGRAYEPVDEDVIVCRCEELTRATLQKAVDDSDAHSMASLKRVTRAGMGRCQGRYCGPTIAKIFSLTTGQSLEEADLWAPRPPAKPVRIADLAKLTLPDDNS